MDGKKADHPVRAETDILNAAPGCEVQVAPSVDENDAWTPIVRSRSAGAAFLWGRKHHSDPVRRLHLESGDVVVWGGPARFVYPNRSQTPCCGIPDGETGTSSTYR
jgi:hypothetical protein